MLFLNVLDPDDLGSIRGSEEISWADLYEELSQPRASHKSELPLVVGASFNAPRRSKDTCKSRNVVPLDLDQPGMTFDGCVAKAKELGLTCIIHTTASHLLVCKDNPQGLPRMRGFVLLSRSVGAEEWETRIKPWMRNVWGVSGEAIDLPRISYAPVKSTNYQCVNLECQPLDVDALPTSGAMVRVLSVGLAKSERVTKLVELFGAVLPPMGHRHDFYLGLTGFCRKQYLPQAECKSLVTQLTINSNAAHELAKRLHMVDETYAKSADSVGGEIKLKEALSYSVGQGAEKLLLVASKMMLGSPEQSERDSQGCQPQDEPPPRGNDEKLKTKPINMLIHDLDTHPDWSGVLAWDTFAQRRVLLKPAPTSKPLEAESGAWTDNDTVLVLQWLETRLGYTSSLDQLEKAIENVCKRHYVNLLTKYLDGLPTSTPGAVDLLADTLGLTDAIERKMLRKWLLSAVARAFKPGTFLKAAMVFQGRQNAGKTAVLKTLFGSKYYTSINADLTDDKRVGELVQGAWVVELEEAHAVTKTDQAAMKRALSLQVDKYRPAYGRHVLERPRTCVFAVTTNANSFLSDETGNVRYYCVGVKDHVDLGRVEGLRERVWAEIRDAYKAGEAIYLTDQQDQDAAAERAREYERTDALDAPVRDYLIGKEEISLDALIKHLDTMHGAAVRANSGALEPRTRAVLQRFGCVRGKDKTGDKRVWKVPEILAKQTPPNPVLKVVK